MLNSPAEDSLLGFSRQLVQAQGRGRFKGRHVFSIQVPPFLSSFCVDGWVEAGQDREHSSVSGSESGLIGCPRTSFITLGPVRFVPPPFLTIISVLSVIPGSSLRGTWYHLQPLTDLESLMPLRLLSCGHQRALVTTVVRFLSCLLGLSASLSVDHLLPGTFLPCPPPCPISSYLSDGLLCRCFVGSLLSFNLMTYLSPRSTNCGIYFPFPTHLMSSESHISNCLLAIPTWLLPAVSDSFEQS